MEFKDSALLWKHIQQTLPNGGVIGISGYGGAGKTELAKAIAYEKAGIQLIHADDYLDWPIVCSRNDDGDGINFPMIIDAHIKPFRSNRKPVSYLVVEGIYLFSESRQREFDLRIWVDTPLEKANMHGKARDTKNQKLWEEVWMPNELAFAKKYNPKQYSDAVYGWDS